MRTADKGQAQASLDASLHIIGYVWRFSWILVVALSLAAWYAFSWEFALSVCAGGVLANMSFYFLSRDVQQFMDTFSCAKACNLDTRAVQRMEKFRFFFKFYARLMVLGLLFFLLYAYLPIDIIGLAVGLSSVMVSVVVVVLGKGKELYSSV
jgi:hypothetical protein